MKQIRIAVWLDKMERQKIPEISKLRKDLTNLSLKQIAHVALKEWIKEQFATLKNDS